jgi:hypothetical protein
MKKMMLYIGIIAFAIIVFGSYFFFKKNYLDYELTCKLPNVRNGEFYPDAYVFFHNKKSIDSFFELTEETKNLKKNIPEGTIFDFNNYSYCIFYGRKVKSMYYSYKTTYFDDPSPSYASSRRYGNKCVFVTYDKPTSNIDNAIYIYRVKRDDKLSGFNGE